jgi:hypothetical protein
MSTTLKICYFNDEKHGVAVSVNDLHDTTLVPAHTSKIFEINISPEQSIFIKKWDKVVLISPINNSNLPENTSWPQAGKTE